jgi:DNA-binding MarR family transcriptional regulator
MSRPPNLNAASIAGSSAPRVAFPSKGKDLSLVHCMLIVPVKDNISTECEAGIMDGYLEVISLIERLHRQFLEVVKLELDGFGIRDINNVQAMMLFNIGDAEMTVGELILRGCYLGSNVSYNVKKMVENGYLVQERSVHDRRSFHVRLTDKGRDLRDRLSVMHARHVEMLGQTAITDADLEGATATLRRLERFWMRASDISQRSGQFAA